MQIDINKQIESSSILTIENFNSLKNEIIAIWKQICWEETIIDEKGIKERNFSRSLTNDEIHKIQFLEKTISSQKIDSLDLQAFSKESIERLHILKQSEESFKKAKELAIKDPTKIGMSIMDYHYLSLNQRFEIAKIVAERNGYAVSKYLENFCITDPLLRYQIAKISVMQNSSSTSDFFHNYDLNDQNQIIEIARIAAAKGGTTVVEYYKIEDKAALFEIIKLSVLSNQKCNWLLLTEFPLTSEQLLEIIKIIASFDGSGISHCIHKLGIKDPSALFEIAKIAAQEDGHRTSEDIKNFGLIDPQELYTVAKIAALQHGWGLSRHIQNYGINNSEHLYEIAKIAALQCGGGTSEYIRRYGITNQKELYEIALIAAKDTHWDVSEHIKQYDLKDPKELYEIAKVAASHNKSLSEHIQNYEIQDQKQLLELAMIAAKSYGDSVSEYIQNYRINNQQDSFSIAKLAFSEGNALVCSEYLKRYKLNLEQIIELFIISCRKDAHELATLISNFAFDKYEKKELERFLGLQIILHPEYNLQPKEKFELDSLLKFDSHDLLEDPLKNINTWFGYVLLNRQLYQENDKEGCEKMQFEKHTDLFENIANLRNPTKRIQLTAMFFKLISEKDQEDLNTFIKMQSAKFFGKKEIPIFRLLFSPFINALERPLMDWQVVSHTLSSSTYKDANAQMTLINSIYSLFQAPHLDMKQKSLLLLKIFGLVRNVKEKKKRTKIVNRNLRLMEAIIQSKRSDMLKQFTLNSKAEEGLSENSIQECLQKIFHEIVGEVEIKDFSTKYESTFLKARQFQAFFTYGAQLQGLPNDGFSTLKPYLRKLYMHILEGDLHQARYESGDHLSSIFSYKEGFKETWVKGMIKKLKSENEDRNDIDNIREIKRYLNEKIEFDDHIPSKDYPFLLKVLKEPTPLRIDESMKELSNLQNELVENKNNEEIKKIKLQITLIALLDPRKSHDEIGSSLDLAKKYVPALYPQFIQDLSDLENLIKDMNVVSNEHWTVEETDHWEDLLLSGTEVLGSCQNINGDPNLNKCLMNYILDGKNRLVVIKNPKGIICARVVLRLLLDIKEKKPVLYQERLYKSAGISNKDEKALSEMCKQKASMLGIPLVRASEEDEDSDLYKLYHNDLDSLNGNAPFEYVDANHLRITNGTFTIHAGSSVIIYDPSSIF